MSRIHRSFNSRRARRFSHAIESLEERRVLNADALVDLDLFRADPRFAGINGSGYSVVVLDHGADLDHPFFGPDTDGNGVADRIVYQEDFGDGDLDASEGFATSGHGTAVTSILGSGDSLYPGVAPGCNLIILKVFPSMGSGEIFLSDLEPALQWIESNITRYNIAAVNLSLTDGGNFAQPQSLDPIADEFARLAGRGVIVVAAAGNSYFTTGSVGGVGYPAADPNVIAVSGVWADNYGSQQFGDAVNNITGPDHVAAFSQRHPTLTDIFAPAGVITTASPGGGVAARRGSSMAAPYITGAAVLAQQLAQRELGRRLTPAEFTDRLKSTGMLINDGDDENDNVSNTGADFRRINFLALGESILVQPGLPSLTISDVTVVEGDTGETSATVTVQISRAPTTAVTVNFITADSSASLSDNDYRQSVGFVAFEPGGPLTQTIQVPIVGDTRHEPNETIRVHLITPVNAMLADSQAIVTILDNDRPLPWRNAANPFDVNDNGFVTGIDALIIINRLNTTGPEVLPDTPPPAPFSFFDVSGDGRVTAIDALLVINELNRRTGLQVQAAGAESDGVAPATVAAAGDQDSSNSVTQAPRRDRAVDLAQCAFWANYDAQQESQRWQNPLRRRR
jgi:hypothetical protein